MKKMILSLVAVATLVTSSSAKEVSEDLKKIIEQIVTETFANKIKAQETVKQKFSVFLQNNWLDIIFIPNFAIETCRYKEI